MSNNERRVSQTPIITSVTGGDRVFGLDIVASDLVQYDVDTLKSYLETNFTDLVADSISFNGGGDALDEYEDGSWTPTFNFATPGDLSVVYGSQEGRYTRIGARVAFNYRLRCTPTFTTSSGRAEIASFPFIADQITAAMVGDIKNVALPVGYTQFSTRIVGDVAILQATGSNLTSPNISSSELVSGVEIDIRGSGIYPV
jgi:hypothetical protein